MIEISSIFKAYEGSPAVSDLSLTIEEGRVFGLLGTNGAGKSTLLRMISGVLRPERGSILLDGQPVWENPSVKERIFYISDEAFFYSNATPESMLRSYMTFYPSFNSERFLKLTAKLSLEPTRKIKTFSKGMKKQLSILLGICSGCDYLLCDETFDGLDPVMRQAVKSLFAKEICDRNFTPVIASHNLRELEDICDHVGLLHKGGVLLSRDLEDMKTSLHKFQFACREDIGEWLRTQVEVLSYTRRGSLVTAAIRGDEEHILSVIRSKEPLFLETLPLSLEEIFISETEVNGYDIKNLIL